MSSACRCRNLACLFCLPAIILWFCLISGAAEADNADAALLDTYTLQGVTATQPRLAGGGYDWDWRGPNNDPEWAWFFNRHAIFRDLLEAYRKTGDSRYRDHLLAMLDDWIASHPAPGGITFSAAWRPLEAARRIMESWIPTWRQLGDDPAAFPPGRKARFFSSLRDHGEHLRQRHAFSGNHLITEMLALAELSLTFPDLPGARDWRNYSLGRLARAYDDQVYPDGSHKELSTHYQRVVALNYQQLLSLLRASGETELVREWEPRVRRLWEYFAAVIKPDGANPLNNDSDIEAVARLLRTHSPDTLPAQGTVHLPYAGQVVFRSRLSDTARTPLWAFFDIGPRGTDHDHSDLLHLSLSIGRFDFLVDNGRYTYLPGPFRDYFAGPAGHNVILLDDIGSQQGPRAVNPGPSSSGKAFIRIQDGLELAYADTYFSSAGNPRSADWRRLVAHVPGNAWIVVDRLITFAPAKLTTLWHWAPGCIIESNTGNAGESLRITHGSHRLLLHYSTDNTSSLHTLRQVSGQMYPMPQGWHSLRFNQLDPAPATLSEQAVRAPLINVWLFTPVSPAGGSTISFDGNQRVIIQLGTEFSIMLNLAIPTGSTFQRSLRPLQ